jgi:hypothetical protein
LDLTLRAGKRAQDQCLAEAQETPTDNSPKREIFLLQAGVK